MKLKPRLELVASKVSICDTVFDIGTDHAYIPIFLIKNKRCNKAVACDIRKGPLLRAKKNIEIFQYQSKIETRMGSGLTPVDSDTARENTVVIAGMGGKLITDILEKDLQKASACKKLIIQPNYAIEVVRQWLYENGFDIVDEELCAEDERIYNVIVAVYSGISVHLEDIYYYLGKKLIEKRDPLLKKYINKKVYKFNEIIKQIEDNGERNVKYLNEIKILKNAFEAEGEKL